MKQSTLFYKTAKESPKDAEALSHKLLTRAGFIDQLMAGVYTFLPLGFRVLKKIENIVREEMVVVGGQELLMPALNPKENWEKTGRWQNFDALFKLKGYGEKDYALAPTHEEIISPLVKKASLSYKDLPFCLFQIQTKFRNEPRAKSGILRTREIIMKDLYSFHASQKDLDDYYQKVSKAYVKIFKRTGLVAKTHITLASGGSFSKYSHEFQTATDSGEDIIYICQKCSLAINEGIKEENKTCPECKNSQFEKAKSVEVGNIFKLGTKYSSPFNLTFRDKQGAEKPVIMGCYGIGLGRLMGTIVEVNNDKDGIIWPREAAPFQIHLVQIGNGPKIKERAEKLYQDLQKAELEVLYDERIDKTPGEKLVDADLIGIPLRLVVSDKTVQKGAVEIKRRSEKELKLVKTAKVIDLLRKENA